VLELLAAVDPPSLLAWAILALAAGMYPLGVILGSPCACCGCRYTVQIKASGFAGGARWASNGYTSAKPEQNIFFASAAYELGESRPEASATPIPLDDGLEIIVDDEYVELIYTQSAGHVLRLSFDGTNPLLDSDDPVTLATVEENTLDADVDWMGNDFLSTIGSWQVRIVKPEGLCRCGCYCAQNVPAKDLPSAPAGYTLTFSEDFVTEEGAFYAPDTPYQAYTPATTTGSCVVGMTRWSHPFSMRPPTPEERSTLGLGGLVYLTEPIAFRNCSSVRFFFWPCIDGSAAITVGGGAPGPYVAFAPNAALPGWKVADYDEDPTVYETDLFGSAIDFGFATLEPQGTFTPDPEAACGVGQDGIGLSTWCFGDCPKTEITMTLTLGSGPANPTSLTSGSYTLDLVPELSKCDELYYELRQGSAVGCQGGTAVDVLGISATIRRGSCGCGLGNLSWGATGLTTDGKGDYWAFGTGFPDTYPCVDVCDGFSVSYPGGGGYSYPLQFFVNGTFGPSYPCSNSYQRSYSSATLTFSA